MKFFKWISYYWVDIAVTIMVLAVVVGVFWSLVEDSRVCAR